MGKVGVYFQEWQTTVKRNQATVLIRCQMVFVSIFGNLCRGNKGEIYGNFPPSKLSRKNCILGKSCYTGKRTKTRLANKEDKRYGISKYRKAFLHHYRA